MNPRTAERARALRKSGDAARDQGNWPAAAAYYSSYLQTRPEDFSIWVQNGHALKEANRLEEARAAYCSAMALNPDDSDLLLHRAHLEKRLGDFKTSATLYLRSYQQDGNSAAAEEIASSLIFPHIDTRTDAAAGLPFRLVGIIERLSGTVLQGWALNPTDPHRRVDIELVVDDAVLATFPAVQAREDLARIGYPDNAAGFHLDLSGLVDLERGTHLALRLKETREPLLRAPFFARTPTLVRDWLSRHDSLEDGDILQLTAPFARGAQITFLMPVFNPRPEWLREALDSVLKQWCEQWRLVCVNDGSTHAETAAILDQYAAQDSRIRTIHLEQNLGISVATNIALRAATTDYVAFMDQDDYLEPEAATRLMDAASAGSSLIYSDEIVTGEDIRDLRFFSCRPAFSHDYYLSHPYFVHLVCVNRQIALDIGGYDETMTISADVDFMLRMMEVSDFVTHIPALLYRWRSHKSSTGHTLAGNVAAATKQAIERHLARLGVRATVEAIPTHNAYAAAYEPDEGEVIIFKQGTSPDGQEHDISQYYLFTCSNVSCIDIDRMKSICSRSDVGAVGATIVSSDNVIQTSGLIVGLDGEVSSSHGGEPFFDSGRRSGYNSSLVSTRDYSAVSGECIMVPASVFHAAGGFDQTLGPRLAAVDLCFKIRSLGYKVLNDGFTVVHRQAPTRLPVEPPTARSVFHQRWEKVLADGDPFYSPLLSPEGDHRPTALDNLKAPARTMNGVKPFRQTNARAISLDPPLR